MPATLLSFPRRRLLVAGGAQRVDVGARGRRLALQPGRFRDADEGQRAAQRVVHAEMQRRIGPPRLAHGEPERPGLRAADRGGQRGAALDESGAERGREQRGGQDALDVQERASRFHRLTVSG